MSNLTLKHIAASIRKQDVYGVSHFVKVSQNTGIITDFSPTIMVSSSLHLEVYRVLMCNEFSISAISTALGGANEKLIEQDSDQEGLYYYNDLIDMPYYTQDPMPLNEYPGFVKKATGSDKNFRVLNSRLESFSLLATRFANDQQSIESMKERNQTDEGLGGITQPPEGSDMPSVVQPETLQMQTEAETFQRMIEDQRKDLLEKYDWLNAKIPGLSGDKDAQTLFRCPVQDLSTRLEAEGIDGEVVTKLTSEVMSKIDASLKDFS